MSDSTRGGRWVYRDVDVHRCDKPPYDRTVNRLDRWQCNVCNKVWIVTGINHHSGPCPGESYSTLVWAEYESWKSGPFPPGTK